MRFPGRTTKAAARETAAPRFPGTLVALDGSAAVVAMETAASEGAGAYPITPSTQMGEGWAAAVADGRRNVNGRRLLFFEPEGEHAAAAVTAGMSMAGLRATNFSSGQGIAYMHESLYAAVGKRLTYVLNVAARAMTKHALNVHAGHDDYHAVDDTGFFQLFARGVQEAADLTLIAHRVAELSLNPGLVAQDGFLTSHVIESVRLPERELVKAYLGDPADMIASPTPAQRLVFGERRRRIPEMFDLDYPAMLGTVQNQDSYAQGVAAQRPFYFDHIVALTDQAMAEFAELTGRHYARAMGYRLDDADYVIVGQGSVVANAEAVADHLRATRDCKVGVLDLTMFRPFPSDLVTRFLAGKRAVVVLERVDQPLAVDAPLLRELRAAMAKGVENHRSADAHPAVAPVRPEAVPDFYSGCFGLGSRDLQPGDLIAAVENMLPTGAGRRQFYLGIDFLRAGTRVPKLQIWQEQLAEEYPHLAGLALPPAPAVNLLPEGSIALRIHSVGGWGAITMGKNVALTAFELFGLHIKANPKYGSEKKGQPTTFYAVLAHEPVRLNSELRHVDVVLSPDPNVFRHSDPLEGLAAGGTFVIQSDLSPEEFWLTLPGAARRAIRDRKIRLYVLDAFAIAMAEASDADLRYRMQGAAFMGAFFRTAGLLEREGVAEDALFAGITKQLTKKFGHRGEHVVQDNLRVIRRGFDELREVVPVADRAADEPGEVPHMPVLMEATHAAHGIGHEGRFWEQVCALCKLGQDGIADPFAAISAIPAVTSSIRDMSGVRLEVPEFIAANCTGCAQCWVQCPDSAIPGLVNAPEDVINAAIRAATNGARFDAIRPAVRPWARETQKLLGRDPAMPVAEAFATAYRAVADKMPWDGERRAAVDAEQAVLQARLAEFPLARTRPYFDAHESKQKGSGGLLSVTINPEACKGCNLCVEVCPDGALVTVRQDQDNLARLRRNWAMWQHLPDTDDRFVAVHDLDEGIGVLPTMLLKRDAYRSMVGGDGACMGCGEKTAVHLIVSAIHAQMAPRVKRHVAELDGLIAALDARARELLGRDADLDAVAAGGERVEVPVDGEAHQQLAALTTSLRELRDLRWRYTEGPSGKGRALLGMANSTGCSSVWGSTYPYNPYPFPWVNHLFQDSPSIAIGIFEAQMRKMADGFLAVRRARALAGGQPVTATPGQHESLDWHDFTDDEFHLCPPMLAMGGDGAMLDIGFQNLSRLLASGKPIRVVVLDTQVYSNTGGQACTSGYTGQVADMSAFGKAQAGKTEVRKELGLLAIAHRGAYVHQSSQAAASHLLAGVLRGLGKRRPAVFNIYTPCPVEHGLADDWSQHAARLALESRAFPFLTYDPDNGSTLADCLSLEGNPSAESDWPEYSLTYVNDDDVEQVMTLPLTIADWAATEARFKPQFTEVPRDDWTDDMVPFHEYLGLAPEDREGRVPFIHAVNAERKLRRIRVSATIVALARERLEFWSQLRQLAGIEVGDSVRENVSRDLDAEYARREAALRAEFETNLAAMRASYPRQIARRLVETLVEHGGGSAVAELLASIPGSFEPVAPTNGVATAPAAVVPPVAPVAAAPPVDAAPAAPSPVPATGSAPAMVAEDDDDALVVEPYIETMRCTTCNECTNLNNRMFAYNEDKQAYIKDATAGTFQQLVLAAERCPVSLIHPGTPLNPKEKDLEKWVKRAERFN